MSTTTDEPTQAAATIHSIRMTPEMTIYERMVAILDELPAIGKDSRNEQQRFMYRAHDDVMAALNPLLAKHGVFVVPRVLERVPGERTTGKGSTMYEVNLHVEFTFYGAGGDSVRSSAWGEGTDMGDKSTNKAMTGAFKNMLAQAFAISTHELSDSDTTSPEETRRGSTAPGRARTAPAASEPFDPGKRLLGGAVSGEGFLARLGDQLHAIHGTLDWSATLAGPMTERFGVEHRSELSDEQAAEYWRRVSNLAAKIITDHGSLDTLPPVTDDEIKGAIKWAFNTSTDPELLVQEDPAVELDEQAAQAAADDIPWPDGEQSKP